MHAYIQLSNERMRMAWPTTVPSSHSRDDPGSDMETLDINTTNGENTVDVYAVVVFIVIFVPYYGNVKLRLFGSILRPA